MDTSLQRLSDIYFPFSSIIIAIFTCMVVSLFLMMTDKQTHNLDTPKTLSSLCVCVCKAMSTSANKDREFCDTSFDFHSLKKVNCLRCVALSSGPDLIRLDSLCFSWISGLRHTAGEQGEDAGGRKQAAAVTGK